MNELKKVEVLVISNIMDFTTDYICLELHKRNTSYIRINRDKFREYDITFNVNELNILIKFGNENYQIERGTLQSVYYRAPVFLRDNYKSNMSVEDQLYRYQWMSFLRNLTVFEGAIWLNNPNSTFKAESKMLQLEYAKKVGFICPTTFLLNTSSGLSLENDKEYIMKSLDTVLLRDGEKESFVYSMVMTGKELMNSNMASAPVVVQEYLNPKVDIRISVVGNKIFPVKITKNNVGIIGDWRKEKTEVDFIPIVLPIEIENKCLELVKSLGLGFGGIDLIFSNNNYYFIEINPTGEWAWLVQKSNLPIDKAICDYLLQ